MKYFIDQLVILIFGVLYFYSFMEIFQYKFKIYQNQLDHGYDPYDESTYVNMNQEIFNYENSIIEEIQNNFSNFLVFSIFFSFENI